jgi:hypothetical protein
MVSPVVTGVAPRSEHGVKISCTGSKKRSVNPTSGCRSVVWLAGSIAPTLAATDDGLAARRRSAFARILAVKVAGLSDA